MLQALIKRDGQMFAHYEDTSVYFRVIDGNIYVYDRDDLMVDIFENGIDLTILEDLGVDVEEFYRDFANKYLTLCSHYDTHSMEVVKHD